MKLDSIDDVFAHVVTEPNTGCWLWEHGANGQGYPTYYPAKWQPTLVHRRVLQIQGRLSDTEQACHKCDTPRCVNPDHLFAGTMSDNILDAVRKGRHRHGHTILCGEAHPHARLTIEKVREARCLHAAGWTNAALARRYGMSETAMKRATLGLNWKGVA